MDLEDEPTHMAAPSLKNDKIGQDLRRAFNHQTHIGWSNFARGRVSKHWYTALYPYFRERWPKTLPSRDSWNQTLIRALLQGFNTQWKTRCGIIHGKDSKEQTEILRKDLMQQVTEMHPHAIEIFRGEHRHLLSAGPEQLKRKPLPYLRAWIQSIDKTLALYNGTDTAPNPPPIPAATPATTHPATVPPTLPAPTPVPTPSPIARPPAQRLITPRSSTANTPATIQRPKQRRTRTRRRVRAEDAQGTLPITNFFAVKNPTLPPTSPMIGNHASPLTTTTTTAPPTQISSTSNGTIAAPQIRTISPHDPSLAHTQTVQMQNSTPRRS